MTVTNPATGETRDVEATEVADILRIVQAASEAGKNWAALTIGERVAAIRKFVALARERAPEIAAAVTEDMGKPIKRSRDEVENAFKLTNHYCDNAESWLAPEPVEGGMIHHQPLGVVGVICPWNFPVYVPLTGLIPALLAGNGIVFKPSEYTLTTGMELARTFRVTNEIPDGLFQIVVGGKEHGKAVVSSDVQMISFTGSTAAGKHIMEQCAKDLKRVHLELGGMDAAIVLADADVKHAARKILQANCNNSGQICCAAKRVYVEDDVYDEFVDAAVAASDEIEYGDPQTEVNMGPLVAAFQKEKVAAIVEDARAKGASIKSGGEVPAGPGFYYPSTVVTDVTEDMRILSEEPFGPVLPIVPVSSWEEGVEKANASTYGLTGSVWTGDPGGIGQQIAAVLEVGQVGINAHAQAPIGSPFGGAKQSGFGRTECKEGMQSYTNMKYVYIP